MGKAHRALHWIDIKEFKKLTISYYDFCGWYEGSENKELLNINAFKEQFTSHKVLEYSGVIYRNSILRFLTVNNLETYNSDSVVNWYSNLKDLAPIEKIIFDAYSDFIRKANLLDIGIGGGRTTTYLQHMCKAYTGIDFSSNFVFSAKKKFKNTTILLADARELPFKNSQFEFINFSFNGIDYVDLGGREKILKEINRVLTPGGIFFFSTHNRAHPTFNRYPWGNKQNSFFTNIKTFFKLLPFIPRKLRNKNQEIFYPDFAIINDSAHNFSLMTFYTTPAFLSQQLLQFGFTDIIFYSRSGSIITPSETEDWIFVKCQKA